MELKNKKVNFLGDSITEGVGTSSKDKIYLNLLKERASLAAARNYGVSGTRIARQLALPDDECRNDFCKRMEKMDADADLVVVFGGTNDFGHGDAPLGSFSDRTPDSFYGACHFLMQGLIEKYPASQLVFMTPLHRENEDSLAGDRKPAPVAPLKTYVDILKEVAEYYAIPVLDLYTTSGIQPRVPLLKELYCPDGLHPNDAGHIRIADKLIGFLKTL